MKITYDKEADAMYIEIQEGEFNSNKKIDDIIIDIDKDGNILGIEIINVKKKMPKNFLSEINLRAV